MMNQRRLVLLWAVVSGLSSGGCADKLKLVDHTVLNGVPGQGNILGSSVQNAQESELFVAFRGKGGKDFAIARPKEPAKLEFVHYVDMVGADRKANPRREACDGSTPAAVSVAKYVEPKEIDLTEARSSGKTSVPVEYRIMLENEGGTPIEELTLVDALPRGFKVEEVVAEDYVRTPGHYVALALFFWTISLPIVMFAQDSDLTDFNESAFEVAPGNGRDHLIVKLGMASKPLMCSGNNHSVRLFVRGSLELPQEKTKP